MEEKQHTDNKVLGEGPCERAKERLEGFYENRERERETERETEREGRERGGGEGRLQNPPLLWQKWQTRGNRARAVEMPLTLDDLSSYLPLSFDGLQFLLEALFARGNISPVDMLALLHLVVKSHPLFLLFSPPVAFPYSDGWGKEEVRGGDTRMRTCLCCVPGSWPKK